MNARFADAGCQPEYVWHSGQVPESLTYILPAAMPWLSDVPRGAVALDAGCGNGAALGMLKDRGWEMFGLEISETGLRTARERHPEIRFDYADLTADLSLHPLWGSCDLVLSFEVVEHVFLPRQFARNCAGLLRPGGRLIVSTPYHGYLKNLALAVTNSFDTHFTALWDYGHIKFWSRRTLSALLEGAGLEVKGFEGAGRVPWLWKSMLLLAEKPR